MIDVLCIDFRSVVQEKFSNLDIGGDVERRLPVAAAHGHEVRVGRDQLLEPLEHAQAGRRVCVHHGAALDQQWRQSAVVVEDAKSPRPPVAFHVDAGAGL
jgi:hypothetical protein